MKTITQNIKNLNKSQFKLLFDYSKHSNSLYNCILWTINEYYKETGKYLNYNKLYHIIKTNEHYRVMPLKISAQILRLADKNYRSFFALLNRKNKGQYAGIINTPKYRKKGDLFLLILPVDQIILKNNILKITKNIKLPFNYKIDGKIRQAIIKWTGYNFKIYIQYEESKKENNYELNENNNLSIDLGINNLASCFSNVGSSFIVNGKPLKSYNKYYNKRKAEIQSELKISNNKHWSNKLSRLTNNRYFWIDNYFNQSISIIIKYCLKYKIKNLIIGYNETWKQNINIGRVNNQKFNSIPYYLFKRKLENKCKEYDINFILTEESYTSKCSFLDNEEIIKKDNYLGKRIQRGLFKSQSGKLLNADINGAANIMRKVFPNISYSEIDGIEAFIVKPLMYNFYTYKTII